MSSTNSEPFSAASDSENEAEHGLQRANASAGPGVTTRSQLRGRPLQRQSNVSQTRSNDEASDYLQHRLAAIQLEFPLRSRDHSIPSTISTPRSATSSMAAASVLSQSTALSSVQSRYTASGAPSLCGSSSTRTCGSSVRTGRTNSHYDQVYGLEEDDNGILQVPEEEVDVRLECCFAFLRCPHVFHDLEQWDRHCRMHFRGMLPATAICPFSGCGWQETVQPGRDVWERRLSHMLEEHGDEDFKYTRSRPDLAVLDHLRRHDLIDSAQYQELRLHGRLSEQPILNTASRREERRRRR